MQILKVLLLLGMVVVAAACSSGAKKYADDYYEEGLIFYERMEYGRSVDSFNKVLELEPDHPDRVRLLNRIRGQEDISG